MTSDIATALTHNESFVDQHMEQCVSVPPAAAAYTFHSLPRDTSVRVYIPYDHLVFFYRSHLAPARRLCDYPVDFEAGDPRVFLISDPDLAAYPDPVFLIIHFPERAFVNDVTIFRT